MLTELKNVRQRDDDSFRRWFYNDYFDLIIWYDNVQRIKGFQLCYDKFNNERALTWRKNGYYSHNGINDGSRSFGASQTPILIHDDNFQKDLVAQKFKFDSRKIDPDIAELVYEKIMEFEG